MTGSAIGLSTAAYYGNRLVGWKQKLAMLVRAVLSRRSIAAICRASSTTTDSLGQVSGRTSMRGGAIAASARTGELGGLDAHDHVVVPLAVEPAALPFAAFLGEAALAV